MWYQVMHKWIQIFILYVNINIMLENEDIWPIVCNFIKRNSICIIAWNAVYKIECLNNNIRNYKHNETYERWSY